MSSIKLHNVIQTLFISLLLLFSSCQSYKSPRVVIENIDYSDEDFIQTEISRINSMLETEPVRALWRAVLLDKEDVISRAKEYVVAQLEVSVENNNYSDAKKYYLSLKNVGWTSEKYDDNFFNDKINSDVPGLTGNNSKAPKSIADCMDGTVTVFVDRGIKVRNGAGYSDIVLGSGFFIDDRGYLITNHHVIESLVDPKYEGYARLYIKLIEDDETKIPAKVVGYDPILDLALLKVEITPKIVFNLGSSSELKIGDKISAIGTPIGLEGTLTSGIVSSTDRKLLTLGNVFQIDAAVNSGNSGGPLIDDKMQVQAVVFAGMLQYQGLNFAIPIEYLRQELSALYSGDMVLHPWIGSYGHTKRNGKRKIGVEIQYVMPGSSAALSGVKEGDVITAIENQKVTSIDDYHFILMGYENETLINITCVTENGEEKSHLVYLDQRPEDPAVRIYNSDFISKSFIPLFGLGMANSSTTSKNSYTINTIIRGSLAEEYNLSVNDSVVVRDVRVDKENKYILAQIIAQRRKNGLLDVALILGCSYDGPYYL